MVLLFFGDVGASENLRRFDYKIFSKIFSDLLTSADVYLLR